MPSSCQGSIVSYARPLSKNCLRHSALNGVFPEVSFHIVVPPSHFVTMSGPPGMKGQPRGSVAFTLGCCLSSNLSSLRGKGQTQVSQETLVFLQQAGGGGGQTEQICYFVPYSLMNSVLHF